MRSNRTNESGAHKAPSPCPHGTPANDVCFTCGDDPAYLGRVIVQASIQLPPTIFDGMARAYGRLESGHTVELFRFYHDEIGFSERELVGLTVEEAVQLRHRRDASYLQDRQ